MTLQDRTVRFLKELELPMTRFCKKVQLTRTPLVSWLNGEAHLSSATLDRIDTFLRQYGF